MSNRSSCERKELKAHKDPSDLSGPPFFSLFSTISLKSPIRNHASFALGCRSGRVFQTTSLFE